MIPCPCKCCGKWIANNDYHARDYSGDVYCIECFESVMEETAKTGDDE